MRAVFATGSILDVSGEKNVLVDICCSVGCFGVVRGVYNNENRLNKKYQALVGVLVHLKKCCLLSALPTKTDFSKAKLGEGCKLLLVLPGLNEYLNFRITNYGAAGTLKPRGS
jgi:hypothetical protein